MTSDTESKSLISATQCLHENIAAANDTAEDGNNLAIMKSTSSIHDIDGNTELLQKAVTSLLQEENVTTERIVGLGPSAMSNLESLQNVPNSESNFGGCVEEPDHTEPEEYTEEDQVKEPVIFEVSKTESSLKKGIAATELSDSDSQSSTCDTRRIKLTNEKSSYSTKENEANINCISTDDVSLCDIFKYAIKTIKNGEHNKLENLCQHHIGLPGYTDDAGRTLLHIAAIYGNGEICQVLLQNSDVQKQLDSQDKEGRTALHYGILHNNKRIKRLLLNNGALSDIPDNNLETALDLALNMINEEEIDRS
ncbi:osteoclast-stimulating factor 1-like [Heptranchias perlo]|uniref:osteoclast-stimulating factor 1-like n=1 Tax=Heptranchias perlo TaxID=212740 RepID=UPI003559A778